MATYLTTIAVILIGTFAVGLLRVWRGPTPSDRILSVLLGGTTGVALLLIFAAIDGSNAMLDTALVLAVLAPVLAAAFVAARRRPGTEGSHDG